MTRSRRHALLGTVTVVALLTLVTVPRVGPQNVLGECELTFDDPVVLGAIPDQAAAAWAAKYRMPCLSHFINVEPLNVVGHIHLSFEDPTISCTWAEAGGIIGFGKQSGNECVAVDWDHEPRDLLSHIQDQWIKIWMEDGSNHQPRTFDLNRIRVGAGPSIQLWYRTQDGSWWFWNQLEGAETWKVETWSKDVMEVRMRGTNSGPGPYTIRNAYLRD